MDFSDEATTDLLNQWVSDNTNQMIPKLFTEKLDSNTLFVILNAVYFKGTWENKFDNKRTYKDDFKVSDSENISTNFMSITE